MTRRTPAVLVAVTTLLISAPARAEQPADFTRDVRPLLARHCFKCHGPDPKARKAKLRLDERDDAIRDRGGYAVIVPARRRSERADRPDRGRGQDRADAAAGDEGNAHSGRERYPAALGRARSRIPAALGFRAAPVRAPTHGPARLLAGEPHRRVRPRPARVPGLSPSPRRRPAHADPPRLPRPDGPAADARRGRMRSARTPPPDAYEKAGRPPAGLASCTASAGRGAGSTWPGMPTPTATRRTAPRSIWPYRDWVIHALNADLPFDRFTIEQIAGDLLPGATLEPEGRHRLPPQHHAQRGRRHRPAEFRFHAMTDRVATTATVWLGLTLGCASATRTSTTRSPSASTISSWPS